MTKIMWFNKLFIGSWMKIIDVQLPKAKALFVESVKLKQWKEMSIVILDSDRQWIDMVILLL